MRSWALRIFAVATISMVRVICLVDAVEVIRFLMSRRFGIVVSAYPSAGRLAANSSSAARSLASVSAEMTFSAAIVAPISG